MVLAQICVFQLIHCYTTQGPKHIGCPRQIILYQISILFARIPFRMCPTNKAERRRHENKTFPIRFRTNFRIDLFSLGSLLLDVGTKGWAVWFSLKLWVISYFHILIYKIAWYIYMHICTCAYTYCLTTKTVGFDYFGMFSNPYKPVKKRNRYFFQNIFFSIFSISTTMKFCIGLVQPFGNMNVKFEYYCCIKHAQNVSKYLPWYGKVK